MKITDLKSYTVLGNESSTPSEIINTEVNKPKVGAFQKVLDAGTAVSNFFGGKGIADTFGSEIAKIGKTQQEKDFISADQPGIKETVGSGIQLGANFIPGVGVGGKLATKIGAGLGTGYALDLGSKLQQDKSFSETIKPGVGTAIGGGLPIAGVVIKPAVKIIGRLVKGLGSGLSGVSTETIDTILTNPRSSLQASKNLSKIGNDGVIEENARQILEGVSKIKREARSSFGKGLEKLSETDIEPSVFRSNVGELLDKFGSVKKNGVRLLENIEFTDPKNIGKASELIDRLSNTKLDGKTIRKLADDIESSVYKIATSDERLSFNAFINDLSDTLKDTISMSTGKLDEINKSFSTDMQLAQATEKIFGKVKFKNLSEVINASQKLESLFSQKGIAPKVIDDFLNRIGVNPGSFRASEAVRQINNKTSPANAKGLSLGEITQQVTSSVVTPKTVKNIAIITGMAEELIMPFLNKLKPMTRNLLINDVLRENQVNSE